MATPAAGLAIAPPVWTFLALFFEGIEAYVVNEYQFELREEYETALQEKKGVEYLDAQLDYGDTQKVLRTYNELIRKKIFYTPVGIDYLRRLRNVLVNSEEIAEDNIMPLYVPSGKKKDSAKVEKYISHKYKESIGTMSNDLKKTKIINRNLIAVISLPLKSDVYIKVCQPRTLC